MKKVLKINLYPLALAFGLALFFSIGTADAQRGSQNGRGSNFDQCDLNGDGVISADECSNGNFRQWDTNQDGQLSRKEFRRTNKGKQLSRKGRSQGQGFNTQGNGKGQGQGFQKGQRPRNGRNKAVNRGQNQRPGRAFRETNRPRSGWNRS